MQEAESPRDEAARLDALFVYHVMDTDPEPAFDELTELVAAVCEVPIALVSLVDDVRQWFKSRHGLEATETPRELAFCAHAILQDGVFEIPDSRQDPRFADNPLVTGEPHVVFYAGAPLVTPAGHKVGTLCAIDHDPRSLTAPQRRILEITARQVVSQLELRKNIRLKDHLFGQQKRLLKRVDQHNQELAAYAYRTSHDLRAPVVRMGALAELCLEDLEAGDLEEVKRNCGVIVGNGRRLRALIDDVIALTRAGLGVGASEAVDLQALLEDVFTEHREFADKMGVELRTRLEIAGIFSSVRVRLQQVLSNLVSNSIKYRNPQRPDSHVTVTMAASQSGLKIRVEDNGLGIPAAHHGRVFDMFERFHPRVCEGSGLGTTIVKRHLEALGATIGFTSSPDGTCFEIDCPSLPDAESPT